MVTLTLVIPTYNENGRLRKALNTLEEGVNFDGIKLTEVIFVDDGSTDGTPEFIESHKKNLEKALDATVRIISYQPNHGRGYAVRTGALAAHSDYILYTDADFSIPLHNLKKCLPFIKKEYDLVFGSKKKIGASELIPQSTLRRIVGYGHSIIASLILGVFAWDYQGGFKLFSRKLVKETFSNMQIERWGFDMEVIFLAKKFGYKTAEIPVLWGYIEDNSKVKLARDIFRALKEMVAIRLNWTEGKYSQSKPRLPKIVFGKVQ